MGVCGVSALQVSLFEWVHEGHTGLGFPRRNILRDLVPHPRSIFSFFFFL